jgi:hypothetical protein
MISTLYFMLLIAFQLWYLTSKKVKPVQSAGYILYIHRRPREYRLAGGVLFMLATAMFVVQLGWMSGVSASLVGVMGVGSLVVMLAPFRTLGWQLVCALYLVFLLLELFI